MTNDLQPAVYFIFHNPQQSKPNSREGTQMSEADIPPPLPLPVPMSPLREVLDVRRVIRHKISLRRQKLASNAVASNVSKVSYPNRAISVTKRPVRLNEHKVKIVKPTYPQPLPACESTNSFHIGLYTLFIMLQHQNRAGEHVETTEIEDELPQGQAVKENFEVEDVEKKMMQFVEEIGVEQIANKVANISREKSEKESCVTEEPPKLETSAVIKDVSKVKKEPAPFCSEIKCAKCKSRLQKAFLKDLSKTTKRTTTLPRKTIVHKRVNSVTKEMNRSRYEKAASEYYQRTPAPRVNTWVNKRRHSSKPSESIDSGPYCIIAPSPKVRKKSHSKLFTICQTPSLETTESETFRRHISQSRKWSQQITTHKKLASSQNLERGFRIIDWAGSPLFWNVKNGNMVFPGPGTTEEVFTEAELLVILKKALDHKKAKKTLKKLAMELKLIHKYKQIKEKCKEDSTASTTYLLEKCKEFFGIRKSLVSILILINERDVIFLRH